MKTLDQEVKCTYVPERGGSESCECSEESEGARGKKKNLWIMDTGNQQGMKNTGHTWAKAVDGDTSVLQLFGKFISKHSIGQFGILVGLVGVVCIFLLQEEVFHIKSLHDCKKFQVNYKYYRQQQN